MAMWWSSSLTLLLLFNLTYAAPSHAGVRHPPSKHSNLNNSLQVTTSVRESVKGLLVKYKVQLGLGENFENKHFVLKSLPDVSMNITTWMKMKDADRLCWDADVLHTFSAHLESVVVLLQSESSTPRPRTTTPRRRRHRRTRGRSNHSHPVQSLQLSHSVQNLQTDLRDLLKQVHDQLRLLNSTGNTVQGAVPCSIRAAPVPMRTTPSASSNITMANQRTPRGSWEQVLEGYAILRDLGRFLHRLWLDFNFLRAKQSRQ